MVDVGIVIGSIVSIVRVVDCIEVTGDIPDVTRTQSIVASAMDLMLRSNLNIASRRLARSSLCSLSNLSPRQGFRSDSTSTRGSRPLLKNRLDLSTATVTSSGPSGTSAMEWRINNSGCLSVVGLRTI
jgi:hypothetical protein